MNIQLILGVALSTQSRFVTRPEQPKNILLKSVQADTSQSGIIVIAELLKQALKVVTPEVLPPKSGTLSSESEFWKDSVILDNASGLNTRFGTVTKSPQSLNA